MPQRRLPRHTAAARHSVPAQAIAPSTWPPPTQPWAGDSLSSREQPPAPARPEEPLQAGLSAASCCQPNSRCWLRPALTLPGISPDPGPLQPLSPPLYKSKAPSGGGEAVFPQLTPGSRLPPLAGTQVCLPCWGAGRPGSASSLAAGARVGCLSQQGLPPCLPRGPAPAPKRPASLSAALPGPVEGKLVGGRVGLPAAGGRRRARQEGTNRKHSLGYITGSQGQVM